MSNPIVKIVNEKSTKLTIFHTSGKVDEVSFVETPSRSYEKNLAQAINAFALLPTVEKVEKGATDVQKVRYELDFEKFKAIAVKTTQTETGE